MANEIPTTAGTHPSASFEHHHANRCNDGLWVTSNAVSTGPSTLQANAIANPPARSQTKVKKSGRFGQATLDCVNSKSNIQN